MQFELYEAPCREEAGLTNKRERLFIILSWCVSKFKPMFREGSTSQIGRGEREHRTFDVFSFSERRDATCLVSNFCECFQFVVGANRIIVGANRSYV